MIRYDIAAQDIEQWGLKMKYIDGKWCMTKDDIIYYDAPTKEMLIEAWANHDMSDYIYPDDDIECK